MSARTKQLLCSWFALLSALPLLALYVAFVNGFADVVATPVIGSLGLAMAALVGVPAAALCALIMKRNPQLPKLFALGSGVVLISTLCIAGLFAAMSTLGIG